VQSGLILSDDTPISSPCATKQKMGSRLHTHVTYLLTYLYIYHTGYDYEITIVAYGMIGGSIWFLYQDSSDPGHSGTVSVDLNCSDTWVPVLKCPKDRSDLSVEMFQPIGNKSMPKIILNDTIKLFLKLHSAFW